MSTQQLTIPMFPLNMVVLPGETKALHIFEERYKQLISDCSEHNAHFGIPFFHRNELLDFGIEVEINKIIKVYENGELDISIRGVRVFKLVEFSKVLIPKLYGAGIVKYEEEFKNPPSFYLQDLITEYFWLLQKKAISVDAFDRANIYSVANLLELSSLEKYDLIKLATMLDKENYLKTKLRLFIHLLKTEFALKANFPLN